MSDIPQAAIDAGVQALNDFFANDEDLLVRGADVPAAQVEAILFAAEMAWPHEPPKRDPASTVAGTATLRSQPDTTQAPKFGFGVPRA